MDLLFGLVKKYLVARQCSYFTVLCFSFTITAFIALFDSSNKITANDRHKESKQTRTHHAKQTKTHCLTLRTFFFPSLSLSSLQRETERVVFYFFIIGRINNKIIIV